MKSILRTLGRSYWLFGGCVAACLGLIGPWLISAASTLSVLAGIACMAMLIGWAIVLFGRPNNKEKES
ncbi:MAG TPA: hypothetical protein VN043_15090 [Rhodanobacter sp.]|nr:hypothetical protein [Rhodanobacter sp.]